MAKIVEALALGTAALEESCTLVPATDTYCLLAVELRDTRLAESDPMAHVQNSRQRHHQSPAAADGYEV